MKKLLILVLGLGAFVSCSDEDVTPSSCTPTLVVMYEGETTNRFTFDAGDLVKAVFYENTDSALVYDYVYANGLQSITRTEGPETKLYEVTYDGSKISKLSYSDDSGIVTEELRFVYDGDQLASFESWIYDPVSAALYVIGDVSFTYNTNSDIITSTINLDFVRLFSIAFGADVIPPYAPEVMATTEYEYGSTPAPNPLLGALTLENPDMAFLKNIPTKLTVYDPEGTVVESMSFVMEFDDKGNVIKATYGTDYLEVTYTCP